MSIALGYSLDNYLSLSLQRRQSDAFALKDNVDEPGNKPIEDQGYIDLINAGNVIYHDFLNKQRSYLNGLMRHDAYVNHLFKLKLFLLDLDLVTTPWLRFLEMLQEINLFI